MQRNLDPIRKAGLERSCSAYGPSPRDWLRRAPAQPGFERIEAFFEGHAYDPHRHDTYAIGVTASGLQCFGYRGQHVASSTGQVIVVGDYPALRAALDPVFAGMEHRLEPLEHDQALLGVAEALLALDPSARREDVGASCAIAVERTREFLDARYDRVVASEELEAVTGLDRYALSRHFRARLGTSPYRYLTMRRLDRARELMRAGKALAEVAHASGFADQSHMTRQFKAAFGLPPGRWQALQKGSDATRRAG